MFEDLCVLFGEPVPNEQVLIVPAALLPPLELEQVVPPVEVQVEVVPVDLNTENPIQMPGNVVNIISDSSDSSGDFWRVTEEHYASDSDPDSVLPLPGVASVPCKHNDSP
ncbi:UNVERIFIED_CONTAM: hypothetical protein Sradi_2366600 [Sesamum radiatum]|uniref:Uncharacterized protein n=1 Tax=Sesamum radiatum TaxID=300843 RepID=A0AAW2T7U7_SESRA